MKRVYLSQFVLFAISFLFLGAYTANAQTKNFNILKYLDIHTNVLTTLESDFVDSVNFEKAIKVGIDAMLESLDPYTELIPAENKEDIEFMTTNSYGGIGAMIRKVDTLGVIIMQPYENSPAVAFGLEPSDVILKIDGEDVKPLTADQCSKKMRGTPGSQVKFLIKKGRTGKIEEVVVTRGKVHTSDVSYYGMLKDKEGNNTSDGYIGITGFTLGGSNDVRNAVVELKNRGAKRIILDLRGNGGGLLDEAVDIVSIFVPQGTLVVSAKGRGENSNFSYKTKKEPVDTQIPLLVMVNSSSASSSEIVSGALQDLDRAVIMGTRTYGKGLVQSFRSVGYDARIKLTISKYYTPSGRCIQIMDYSHRNADGSVGSIPDSLKKPFKTLKGRTVYDGGGITPDTTIKAPVYNRMIASVVLSGLLDEYAVDYYKNNIKIAPAGEINLSDSEYEKFVQFASKRDFDSKSGAEVLFAQMLKVAKEENSYEQNKAEYDALSKKLQLSKSEALRANKNEIKPLLEAEIAQKYYYIFGQVESQLRYDTQLQNAIEAWGSVSL